ncbi:AbrB/MazE/SpoVT family DNA-binding domain-containing protein [Aphanothece sacrum]|uniref:AbrB family transcriptional regulator n=1 Tax=Aphanothece sacrum FPU1 TaxID=1920663 RepID=A0A401IKI9_APHSA|nr:AbrB/MazE/SpoVT family DNA-binding domain-containing protein [Aphanothece sacrum]GBF81818.1 AbrB family transcriptional regulator [Aphanothece sacrum FPU1]GBF84350.1 transcriptional regulator, AbrB family [Aphanothece sacrum FPU3]
MASAIITPKGQVTIPQEIIEHLKLDTGTKVDFVILENGEVKIIPLNTPVKTLSGILERQEKKAITLEDMEKAISKGANDWT